MIHRVRTYVTTVYTGRRRNPSLKSLISVKLFLVVLRERGLVPVSLPLDAAVKCHLPWTKKQSSSRPCLEEHKTTSLERPFLRRRQKARVRSGRACWRSAPPRRDTRLVLPVSTTRTRTTAGSTPDILENHAIYASTLMKFFRK